MYYLLLELPAIRQLTVTRGEWARGLERGLEAICARYRVREVERSEDFRLYLFPPVHHGTVQELLGCLGEIQETLEEVKEDLLGYTLLLHRSESVEGKDMLRGLKERLLPGAFEDGLWFTEEAASQLRTICELTAEEESTLFRVESMASISPFAGPPLLEIVSERPERRELDRRLRRLLGSRGKRGRSALYLRDCTGGTLRWGVRRSLEESAIPWVEAEPRSFRADDRSLRSVPAFGLPEAGSPRREEIEAFKHTSSAFGVADLRRSYADRPEEDLRDLWREGLLLLLTYEEPPLLVCGEVERWTAEEVALLEEILEEADPQGRIAILCFGFEDPAVFKTLPLELESAEWRLPEELSFTSILESRTAGEGGMERYLSSLEEREMMVLFLHGAFGEHLSPRRLEQIAGRLGLSAVEYRRGIERFIGDGLLWERPDATLLIPGFLEQTLSGAVEAGTRTRVSRLLGTQLLELQQQGELEHRPSLLPAMLFAADDSDQERLLRDYLWSRLPRYDADRIEQWLFGFDALRRDRFRRLTRLFEWRSTLAYPGEPGELPFREVGSGGILEAEYELAMAEEHYVKGLLQKSLQMSKRALAQFMHLGDLHGTARSYIQLGLVAMGRGELSDAAAYLGYGAQSSAGARDEGLRIAAEALRSVVTMVYGNFSRVVLETPDLALRASAIQLRNWELFLTFLYGRALFELGRNEEAETAFAAVSRLGGTDAVYELARRWVWRAFMANPEASAREPYLEAPEERQSREWRLFLLDDACLRGGERESSAQERTIPPRGATGFHPLYTLDWSTGFSSVEDLVDFCSRRTLDLLLYGLERWHDGEQGRREAVREDLRWLTREGPVSPTDPNRRIYLYLYSKVLPREEEATSDDRATVLGKSIKLLQERTARLDRSGDKDRYQRRNRWNGALLREGRLLNIC